MIFLLAVVFFLGGKRRGEAAELVFLCARKKKIGLLQRVKLKGSVMLASLSFFFGVSHVAHAQDMPIFDSGMLGVMMDNVRKKPKTEDESLAFVQAYFLETLFLRPMMQEKPSLLSEEERQEMGSFADTDMQDQLITREMAEKMAKQDVLGLNKHFRRHSVSASSVVPVAKKEVNRYTGGFVIGKVPQ